MCCGGWVRNARVRQLCSKALRMRSACYAIFCLARAAADGSFHSVLLPGNPRIQRNLRMMSVQDQEETDPLSFTEAQQAWIERLVAAKISEAASTRLPRRPCLTSQSAQAPPSSQPRRAPRLRQLQQQFTAALVGIHAHRLGKHAKWWSVG